MATPLTAVGVKAMIAKGKPTRITDASVRGLMLEVSGPTSASWTLRFQRDGRTRWLGLGSAFDVPLAQAREAARRARAGLADGRDPVEARQAARQAKAAQGASQAARRTFRQVAEECHRALEPGWSNREHAAEFLSSLERWVFPVCGDLDVAAVDRAAVCNVMQQPAGKGGTFWQVHPVTADRVRSRIARVLDYARGHNWRSGDNCASWKGNLDALLPAARKVRAVQHHRALPFSEVPSLMTALAGDSTIASSALQFLVLTAARMSEALGAEWSELSDDLSTWSIPASRMKGRRPHIVPMGTAAVALLRALPTEADNPFVFLGAVERSHVTAPTVTSRLRLAGRSETIHGFRSSFRDWAEERGGFGFVAIEQSLAHVVGGQTERAYRRTSLLDERRRLMEAWGQYCTASPGNVVALRA